MPNDLVLQNELSNPEILLLDVIEDFLATKNSAQTIRSYRNDLLSFFNHLELTFLNDLALIKFPVVVEKTIAFIRKQEKKDPFTDKVKNPSTVNRKAYALSSFFNYLIDVYNYPKNPIKQFQPHKTERKSNTTSLTRAEAIDVLKYTEGKHRKSERDFRNHLIIIFLNIFALRRNELVGLTWDDVNFQECSINVYQKGGSTKLLPIPPNIMYYLESFKNIYPTDSAYIFRPTTNNTTKDLNKPLTTSYIFQLIEKITKEVVPDKKITPHSFRKTFIELSIANKEDFVAICNATGHTNINMLGYYCASDRLKHNAVHGMARIL
jgi:integrase